MMSPQKLGLLGGKAKPKKSSGKKAPSTTDGDDATNKVKREINSRPKRLSKELAAVCGKRTLSRHEVVKHFWIYVRKHNLQDPMQKSTILCDKRLRAVTNMERLESKEVFASLKPHLTDL